MPFFYILTRVLGLPLGARLLALFVFATAQGAFSQQIEPEGLAEATGTLTLIWLAIGLKQVHENPGTKLASPHNRSSAGIMRDGVAWQRPTARRPCAWDSPHGR